MPSLCSYPFGMPHIKSAISPCAFSKSAPADEHAKSLAIRKLDTSTWRVTGNGTITVTYAILWDDPGPFAAQLNNSHAFMNLAMICFYDQDRRNEDISLAIQDLPANWHIATPLRAGNAANTFVAAKYDELVDSPIECGTFQEFELEGITPPVHVVVHGNNWDRNQLADGLARIVRSETSMMGGAPYSQYTFIFHFGNGGGGMEHANGTAIGSQSTNGAISTAAHEFFHLWNVKRIRPQTLEPVDYSKEMPTRALWFAEGVTSTYGSYTLVRSDLWSQQQFYADLGGQITQLESRPARQWQSVEESSLDAWLEKYPHLQRPRFQRELLQQRPARWRNARRFNSRRHQQSQNPRRPDARHERKFRQARPLLQRQRRHRSHRRIRRRNSASKISSRNTSQAQTKFRSPKFSAKPE